MKLPLGWLADFVEIGRSSDEVADIFARLGFPVESIERRPHLSGVTTGKLVRVEKHPNADRLLVCTVDIGSGGSLTIATAATNVAVGQVVPVATIGAKLVGLEIAPREMRGLASQGMLVSAGEIGLEPEWFEDGILQLEADVAPGTDFIRAFRLDADVLDVEVTANRVDAMSVLGLAREFAAATGSALREPEFWPAPVEPAGAGPPLVSLESPDCRRFVAQRFSNARVRVAPFALRVRLALAGQRPINNLVDISNFAMLETAQPLHFYDYDRLAGHRLRVRDARAGEKIRTLDGTERTLGPAFLVVADEREAQGVAGVMGGADSEVGANTTELLLEAASFSGPRVRRMSLALGLRSEASSRHEKGVPPGLGTLGAARAAFLLAREGVTVHAPHAFGQTPAPAAPIALSTADVRGLLGMEVEPRDIETSLRALGFEVERHDAGAGTASYEVKPPYWRGDVTLREDAIEEVGRIAGYDRIEAQQPPVFAQDVSSQAYDDERRVARELATLGYREAITWALQPASVAERYRQAGVALPGAVVEILNPLSEDQRFMRFSLLPGLLALVARFGGTGALRYFEIGHVFEGAPDPFETPMAAWLLAAPASDEPPWHDPGFLEFKGDTLALVRALAGRDGVAVSGTHSELHPGRTASVLVDDRDVARIGAVDPRLLATYGIEDRVYAGLMRFADLPAYRVPHYVPASRFPAIERDIAVVVADGVPAMDIEHAVREAGDGMLAGVQVFDEYRGPQVGAGQKSIAVHIVLQRKDATLTDADAEARVRAILASLAERCDARIRT